MDNKYYAPKIEEFHVGFEFEYKAVPSDMEYNDGYIKTVFDDKWNIPSIKHRLDDYPIIRVKCLDSEDVESLGFEYGEYSKGRFKNELIELNNVFSNVWTIHAIGDDYRDKLFEGIIKNKSELKWIMKALSIV